MTERPILCVKRKKKNFIGGMGQPTEYISKKSLFAATSTLSNETPAAALIQYLPLLMVAQWWRSSWHSAAECAKLLKRTVVENNFMKFEGLL